MNIRWQIVSEAHSAELAISNGVMLDEVLFPINHRNYNFREKKISQVMKERKKKEGVNFLMSPRLKLRLA